MKEKKKSAVSWILTWAGQKRIAYVWSVLLAIGNVIFKILPYFIIADVVKLFLNGEKEFETYLAKAVLIALSFIIAELLHSLSTALSHKATFAVLANIRKSCCDKLARVPLGYVKGHILPAHLRISWWKESTVSRQHWRILSRNSRPICWHRL